MTIAGLEASKVAHAVGHSFEVLVNGTPDPFWDEVRRHVVSWLIICGVGGVGWLAVQMPIRLDRVLTNQDNFRTELQEFKSSIRDLEVRMARQEAGGR